MCYDCLCAEKLAHRSVLEKFCSFTVCKTGKRK